MLGNCVLIEQGDGSHSLIWNRRHQAEPQPE
jgi:hypothetical protein